MKFNEIPINFRKKIINYLNKLLKTKQIKNNKLIINGISDIPINIKTQHLKLKLGSTEHYGIIIQDFYLLYIFNEFAEKNKFNYSINGGNMIGYIRDKDMLIWDDDIDIIIDNKGFKILENLWYNNYKYAKKIFNNKWSYIEIIINSNKILLLKKNNKNFFKFKLNNYTYKNDLDGIDIVSIDFEFNHLKSKTNNNFALNKLFALKYNINNNNIYKNTYYGPIKTKIFIPSICYIILYTHYGKKWLIKKYKK
jgi:phosphorylcholine metabolism protein LicD